MVRSVRLYSSGIIMGYRRSHRAQRMHTSLIKIRGVETRKDTEFYLGKKIAYAYRVRSKVNGSKKTVVKKKIIWGKVMRPHGNSGVVRAKFTSNLPCTAIAKKCKIMLYPSRI